MKNPVKILFLLSFLFFNSCSSDDDTINDSFQSLISDLQGEWVSDQLTIFPINIPDSPFEEAFLKETFEFNNETNKITSIAYLDRELTIPVLIYQSVGPFEILRESMLFPNTWEADFGNTEQTLELTTSDPEILALFGFESCGITETGVVYSINEGCSIFPSITECVEKDIIQVMNGKLRFGTRTADICEVRVTTLQDTFYTKKN